jgi:glycosyltransferase involved in cell wall biosynthesis
MIDRFALHVVPATHPASDAAPAACEAAGSAGSALLRAVAESTGLEHVGCFAAGDAHADACKQALRQLGYRGSVERIASGRPQDIGKFGTLYHPSADIARLAWRRLAIGEHGERRYSLCGNAHASASHAGMQALAGLLAAPVRNWDAVICPSRAVRDSVRVIIERQADYLGARLGATRFELPQMPLIPPGVHSRDFQIGEEDRRAARERLGIGADDVVFLYAGGPSLRAGAHPQQMLSALERAARAGRTVHLLSCGGFADGAGEQEMREAAAVLAPSIRLTVHDEDTSVWAAADVFTALDDSVRHDSPGASLKAMAAGLPCVVSDWGRDRDIVRDGVDGYRIPTTMPGAGAGIDLAQRYDDDVDSYDQYCGHMGQAVAVDGAALAQVYARLISDAGLRRELGANGRRRVQQEFDWAVVFARYRQLWSELDERRRADAALTPALPPAVPDRLDPFALFASYPSVPITPASLVELAPDASLALLRQYRELAINRFAQASLPTLEAFGQIVGSIGSRPTQVDELMDTLGPCDRPTLLRGLAWMCKMDLLRISPPEET